MLTSGLLPTNIGEPSRKIWSSYANIWWGEFIGGKKTISEEMNNDD